MDEQPQEPDEQEPGPVPVPVARDWTGAGTEEIAAEDVVAAQHWDQRMWRQAWA